MRYLVFGGEYYYPRGGWGDFRAMTQTITQAKHIAEDLGDEIGWAHIVDVRTGKIIWIGHDYGECEGICAWRRPEHETDLWGEAFIDEKHKGVIEKGEGTCP